MPQCLQCKSQRVATGTVVAPQGHGLVVFRPRGLRFLSITAFGGTELTGTGFACLDCGLVWSSTPPDRLDAFIKKHCDESQAFPPDGLPPIGE